jgi:hypothetical protein
MNSFARSLPSCGMLPPLISIFALCNIPEPAQQSEMHSDY